MIHEEASVKTYQLMSKDGNYAWIIDGEPLEGMVFDSQEKAEDWHTLRVTGMLPREVKFSEGKDTRPHPDRDSSAILERPFLLRTEKQPEN